MRTCVRSSATTLQPGRLSTRSAAWLAIVAVGKKSAASCPSSSAARRCSSLTVGSSRSCSSPTSAAAIAARIPGDGFVAVSERRSITVRIEPVLPLTGEPVRRASADRPNDPMSSLPSQLRPARLDPAFKQSLRPFLGTILLRRGRVTQERLDAALAEVERSGRRLGDILLERRWLYESELAQALAEQNELDYVDIAARSVDPKVAARLPRDFAEYFRAVPVRTMSSGAVMVAVADPADLDAEILRIILHADVQLVVGELTAIRQAWRHCP